jgi:hypothetical protein
MAEANHSSTMVLSGRSTRLAEQEPPPTENGVAMNAPEQEPTERRAGSLEAKRLAIAVLSAGACIAVAAIAVALWLLF